MKIATVTHAVTITLHQIYTQTYLYSLPPYPTTIGYSLTTSSPDMSLAETGTHTHYYTNSTTLKSTFNTDHVSHENFPSILNHALFCILHSTTPQYPHLQKFLCKFSYVSSKLSP